jgi:hypothetical protein
VWRDGNGASVDVGGGAESRRGWAADVSARAAHSRHWWVPAAAATIARSGEGVQRMFRSASGSVH